MTRPVIDRPIPAGSKPYGMSACNVTFARPADAPIKPSTMQSIYDGAELRAPLRAGAADHENHPSRAGNLRVWRSGRQERA